MRAFFLPSPIYGRGAGGEGSSGNAEPLGWVSRLARLPANSLKRVRRYPPSAPHGISPGGLRGAPSFSTDTRPAFCAANPPYGL